MYSRNFLWWPKT